MRDASINTHRETSADRRPAGANSMADLNNQLYRAYLSGDGAAVERVLALMDASPAADPARVDAVGV